jgi:long-chain acyl-CoA synthetase
VGSICVHGNSDAKQPIAIIFPHEGNLRQALQSSKPDLAKADFHTICHNEEVGKMVMDSCNAAGKKAGFKGMEMLQAVILTNEEWTPENGLLTAAHKLQRKNISDAFAKEMKVGVDSYLMSFYLPLLTGRVQEVPGRINHIQIIP